MKKPLHKLASLLCLLTLLLGTATCLQAEQPKQSSCNHCPKSAPLSHSLPSCCTTQHQPPAATSAEVERPAPFLSVLMPMLSVEMAPLPSSSAARVALPPPSPPRIALRI